MKIELTRREAPRKTFADLKPGETFVIVSIDGYLLMKTTDDKAVGLVSGNVWGVEDFIEVEVYECELVGRRVES